MTDSPRTPLPMATTGCSCCAPAPAGPAEATALSGRQSPDPVGTSTGAAAYQVEGMTCGHCVGSVAEAVSALDGADDVRVELVAGGASLVTVTGPASADAVQAAIEAAGYRVLAH